LSVDVSNPWGDYSTNGSTLLDAFDGTWYQTSYEWFLQSTLNPEVFCFNPFMAYVDKTGADGIENNTLESFMLISPIIKQSKREESGSWFIAGFVPNLTMVSSAGRRGQKGRNYSKSAAVHDYHRCLGVILQPLKDTQRLCPALNHQRGDQVKCLRTVTPLAGVVGDGKSHDTLACRKGDYG
jgi:hypothetical protein